MDMSLCLDCACYPLKTAEKVAASMSEAKGFSTLDPTSGFYQIKLAEESTRFTRFNKPFRRCNFERLSFGLVSAPEVFQRAMSDV